MWVLPTSPRASVRPTMSSPSSSSAAPSPSSTRTTCQSVFSPVDCTQHKATSQFYGKTGCGFVSGSSSSARLLPPLPPLPPRPLLPSPPVPNSLPALAHLIPTVHPAVAAPPPGSARLVLLPKDLVEEADSLNAPLAERRALGLQLFRFAAQIHAAGMFFYAFAHHRL
ncbi:hypothetical protein HMN09_00257900 [Mycena chlorophos]|uniref:Uncharacterized protein n=1 Tax=Mycena chlorophos TaxID=658473 RepID=A0A8H6TM64_MYCCL|nr:hypothetical protein HMN09_00257900 [Mycena chlorophos]